MSEQLHAREKQPSSERCGFCHDAFADDAEAASLRIECAKCGAAHHAGCFVENGGCSVLACGGTTTRKVGANPERLALGKLAVLSGALVDRPLTGTEKLARLRTAFVAAGVVAGVAVITLLMGLASFGALWIIPTTIVFAIFGTIVGASLHYGMSNSRTTLDERMGPPCPRCGEALGVARDGVTFCYRCDAPPDAEAP